VFTRAEILILGRAYRDHRGGSWAALGTKAVGNNRFFEFLLDGKDCYSSNLETASEFFVENWPYDELVWPLPLVSLIRSSARIPIARDLITTRPSTAKRKRAQSAGAIATASPRDGERRADAAIEGSAAAQ
jgi:hypothetical protein